MSKTVIVRLTSNGYNITGPFKVSDDLGNVLSESVPYTDIYIGKSYTVVDEATSIVLQSLDNCNIVVCLPIEELTHEEIYGPVVKSQNTGSLWIHLINVWINNKYYNKVEPYILEYPFSYEFHDEILQNVKDYTRVYKYLTDQPAVYDANNKVQTDSEWFNKAIIYNGQQSSGMLNLVAKPMHNLHAYMQYPIYNSDSKTITYTKSDNFYQYNTFWNVLVDRNIPMFLSSCQSMSIDKVLNQANMNYGVKSFKKEPLRGKGLAIRHILDNRSDIHMISQFVITPAQISYK